MSHATTKAPETPHSTDSSSHDTHKTSPGKTERYTSSPGMGPILIPIALVIIIAFGVWNSTCAGSKKVTGSTTSPSSGSAAVQYDIRRIGTFILAPGETSEWFELPPGAACIGATIDPNPGFELLMTDRVNVGDDTVHKDVSVMIGNSINKMQKVRYKNTLKVTASGVVNAWYIVN